MPVSINVPKEMREDLTAFLSKENIALEVSGGATGDIIVVPDAERRESSISVLCPGGWIKCEVALAMADKLSIKSGEIGKILNYFDVKIRDCSLGCF